MTVKKCFSCNGDMKLLKSTKRFNMFGKEVDVHTIPVYRCVDCGMEVYDSNIARIVEIISQKKAR